jgi:hypothetical protein
MSQQGPGGYGGYPPGGGPPGGYGGYPPGGGPPGGYGPPGSPPGGYGGPGAPGGHGGPGGPGYGAPPPPGPPAKKGTSPVVWLGVGCGVLMLLGGAGAAWFFYTASQGISAALAVGSALADGGISITVPPGAAGGAGGTLVLPGPAGLATGGPACEQAAQCCRSMVAKSGGNPAAEAACDNMKAMPQVGCVQALETYKRSAPLVGATCP